MAGKAPARRGQEMTEDIIASSIRFARERMAGLKPSHGWDHVQRVAELAQRIGLAEGADAFIVRCAAILHDIARGSEDNPGGGPCHAELGSRTAYEFLTASGLDVERAERIAHCILTHRFRGGREPKTLEARVVHDADKLDSIGAVGIGRAFLFAGEVGAKLHNGDTDVLKTSAYTEEDTAYREYMVKLRRVKDRLLTPTGRSIAKGRHDFMVRFFERLQEEADGTA